MKYFDQSYAYVLLEIWNILYRYWGVGGAALIIKARYSLVHSL